MTRSYEDRHPGESWLLWKLGNWTAIPQEWIESRAFAWGFQRQSVWDWKPVVTGNNSLYFNGLLFIRLSFPFDIRFGTRWSGRTTAISLFGKNLPTLFQCGLGWKLNGRFAPTFRFQSDKSAMAGTNSPNYLNGIGWEYGSH